MRNHIVAQERKEESGDNGDLLKRGHRTAVAGRSHLTDVGRAENAGGTDGKSPHHAEYDELERTVRDAGTPGAHCKEERRKDQDRATAEFISKIAGQKCSDRTTQKRGGDIEAGKQAVGMKGLLEAIDSAIDDTAVISEQETSYCGDGTDQDDETCIRFILVVGGACHRRVVEKDVVCSADVLLHKGNPWIFREVERLFFVEKR